MHPKYQRVIFLRKRGKSYREIANLADVSKNSVSRWCKNLKLPIFVQRILEKKNKQNREIFAKYNLLKHERVQKENLKITKDYLQEIHKPSKYELKLIGAALYWGEGQRRHSRIIRIDFSNSDPGMISLFLRFLREIMQIPEERIKPAAYLHKNINKEMAIKFWSKITKIPPKRFRTTIQISRASQRKRPSNSLPYGTLHLAVNSRQKFFQIKGWIDGLIHQT